MLWLEEQPWMGKSWLVPIVRLYCAVCKEDYVWWTILSSFQTSDMFLVFCCINAVLEVHINNIDNCMFHIPYHNLFFPALKYILFLFVWLLGFSNILTDKLTCSDTFPFPSMLITKYNGTSRPLLFCCATIFVSSAISLVCIIHH